MSPTLSVIELTFDILVHLPDLVPGAGDLLNEGVSQILESPEALLESFVGRRMKGGSRRQIAKSEGQIEILQGRH